MKMPSTLRGCPVTLTLIAINIAVFLGQLVYGDRLTNLGSLIGPYVAAGQYWRILTSGFFRASILHIGFNMYLLYVLGPHMEQGFGSKRFTLMYFGSLFGGSLAVMIFNFNQPTLGASGAVLGLAGAMFVALWSRGVNPRQSPVFGLVILNLALPLFVPVISFWGHFGGVAGGAAMAYVLVWLPDRNRKAGSANSISQGAALVVLLAVACVLVPLTLAGSMR